MSIVFVTALPGHGKGVFNMHETGRRLETSNRRQLTTMTEILPDKLGEYIRKRNPNPPFTRNLNMDERLYFIPKQDTHQFYRYRGNVTLPPPPELKKTMSDAEKDSICVEYFKPLTLVGAQGVDYLLTEAHRHFRSEGWDSMSYIVMWYLTQHRHFDDNIVIETQLPGQVVVQMRRLADECIQLQNDYKRKIWGFKRPGRFIVKRFYRVPTTESAEPYETGSFRLDPEGWAGCYRTRGAVAEGTGTPETDTNKKAPPFWMLVAAIVGVIGLALGAIMLVPRMVGSGIGMFMHSTQAAVSKGMGEGLPSGQPPQPAQGPQPLNPLRASQPPPPTADQKPKTTTYATGYAIRGNAITVTLSDGTIRSTNPGTIERLTIKGETFDLKGTPALPKSSPPPLPPPRSGENLEPQPVKKESKDATQEEKPPAGTETEPAGDPISRQKSSHVRINNGRKVLTPAKNRSQ